MLLAAKMPLELDTYVPPFAIHHSRHCDQLDYSELNLAESDSSSSSMIGLMQSSECCRRAKYLTKKGSIIDSNINWRRGEDNNAVAHLANGPARTVLKLV